MTIPLHHCAVNIRRVTPKSLAVRIRILRTARDGAKKGGGYRL